MSAFDSLSRTIGNVFLACGGLLSMTIILAVAAILSAELWIIASNKWRKIVKVESLIHEYCKNRREYLKWKESQK